MVNPRGTRRIEARARIPTSSEIPTVGSGTGTAIDVSLLLSLLSVAIATIDTMKASITTNSASGSGLVGLNIGHRRNSTGPEIVTTFPSVD